MAGSGACSLPHRRLPDSAYADTNPDAAYADQSSSQRGLRTAHAHTDSYTYAETHRYALTASNGHTDPDSGDGHADSYPNAGSAPANTRRDADPDPTHQDASSDGDS